ncbi:MAG: cytochrome c maturation protein CcmE [Planctomycetota bacterium]|nr:cytochrome c maturation protein CcmE [Planctomycetota bacterium]
MHHMRIKLIVGGLAILVAAGFLAMAGVREGWVYSLNVDEFLTDGRYHDQRVRLEGTVSAEDLEAERGLLRAGFHLLGASGQVRVEYNGVIPDLFKPGHDVVVEGRLDDSGVFQADTLMTKCASKYESETGQGPPPDHPDLGTAE